MSVLHSYYEHKISDTFVLSDLDREIIEVIETGDREYYDGLIDCNASPDVFLNLTRMRNSLLNWYDFKADAEILEIGSKYGALTGLLCDKGKHVTACESDLLHARIVHKRYQKRDNLDIYVRQFEDVIGEKKFDYIVVTEYLELLDGDNQVKDHKIYTRFLSQLKSALKEDGILLFSVENRYGLKYFCGEPDPYSGIPFDGINKYPAGSKGHLFSRQEIIDRIEDAGFSFYRFYYPLPDYKLPQAVYSEEYMPKGSIRDRVIPYYLHQDKLIAVEDNLFDDLIHNRVLGFFANSFLIECRNQLADKFPIFAAVSTDREEAGAFATVIYSNQSVLKKALFDAGKETLETMDRNLSEMRNRGIAVVPCQIRENGLEMPCIEQINFADYLAGIIRSDKERFEELIEELYQCILRSSDHVSIQECALSLQGVSEEEMGPILRCAYIDMIPYNCFYQNGEIVFYDQEFMERNFPAKYVLFRALRYMYIYIPDAEFYIPLSYFKEKYRMERVWQSFEVQEGKFTERNRNEKELEHFYKWTSVDKVKIYNRSRKPEEKIAVKELKNSQTESAASVVESVKNSYDYEKDEELIKIKKAQLDIYKYFLSLCDKYHLRYCAIYGTLLGSVRHSGFIPWDDDIDLAMPRQDYDKLCEIARRGDIESPFFLQLPDNDPECFYGGYGKLRNSNTTEIDSMNKGKNCNKGICIDIFPLDQSFADEVMRERQIQKIEFYQELLFTKVYSEGCQRLRNVSDKRRKKLRLLSHFCSHAQLCKRLERALKMCKEESGKIAVLARYVPRDQRCFFNADDFSHSILWPFEDMKMMIPIGYKNWLKQNVGLNYKIYPPKALRKPHHFAKYDTEKSYQVYDEQEKRNKK